MLLRIILSLLLMLMLLSLSGDLGWKFLTLTGACPNFAVVAMGWATPVQNSRDSAKRPRDCKQRRALPVDPPATQKNDEPDPRPRAIPPIRGADRNPHPVGRRSAAKQGRDHTPPREKNPPADAPEIVLPRGFVDHNCN